MKKRTFLKSMALPLGLQGLDSFAQDNAGRPIRIVVPLPAGSGNDFVARVIGPHASQFLGQPIIVDNKPGANGVIGAMEVVRAAPDGLTLLCATNSHLATNVSFVKNLPYDPLRDFTPIAGAVTVAQMLIVSATSPYRTFSEFLAYAKQNPGKVAVSYSTSVVQLQFLTMAKMAGIELLLVPYKSNAAAMPDMLSGLIHGSLDTPGSALPHVQAGKIRVLASMSKRAPFFPDVPAASEFLPGFDFPLWNGFVGPAGMPRAQVMRLNAAIVRAQRQADVAQKFHDAGSPAWIVTPDEMKAVIEAEIPRYQRLSKSVGIEPA